MFGKLNGAYKVPLVFDPLSITVNTMLRNIHTYSELARQVLLATAYKPADYSGEVTDKLIGFDNKLWGIEGGTDKWQVGSVQIDLASSLPDF